jgi:O-antigen ligase
MEILLVIYILSGIIKGFFLNFGINTPIDITVIFAVLSILAFLIEGNISTEQKKFRFIPSPVIFLVLFWFWMLFTLLYTTSTDYAYIKVFYFATNIIPVYLILKKQQFRIILFLKTYIILVFFLVLVYLPIAGNFYVNWDEEEVGFIRMYLALGENLGFIVLILFLTKKNIFNKNVDLILSLVAFVLLLAIGARGPLLFVVIVLLINFIFKQKRKLITLHFNKLVVLFLLLLISCCIAYMYRDLLISVSQNSLRKLSLLTEVFDSSNSDKDPSVMVRVEHYRSSSNIIFRNLSTFLGGTGVGSYEMEVFGTDGNNHPHNQILEILTELGLVGLLIYLLFFISLLKNIGKSFIFISKLVIIYSILNLLKSSSLVEIRIPLTIIALSVHSKNLLLNEFDSTENIEDKKGIT